MDNWILKRALISPNKIAVRDNTHQISFLQLKTIVGRIVSKLGNLIPLNEKRIAIITDNNILGYLMSLSIISFGASIVFFNKRLSNAELNWQLNNAGVRYCLIDDLCLKKVNLNCNVIYFNDIKTSNSNPKVKLKEKFDVNDIASIMFTSGTTGFSKACLQSFKNHLSSAISTGINLNLSSDDEWLCVVPIFHISGFSIILRGLIYGFSVRLVNHFNENDINNILSVEPITIISVVPYMLRKMLNKLTTTYQNKFRFMFVGGAPIDKFTLHKCLLNKIPVVQSYGMTETCSNIISLNFDSIENKLGSIGKPLFLTQYKLGKDNELLIKTPALISGYLNCNINKYLSNGWYRTGDIAHVDKEGFIYIDGRKSELIISGGENIFPSEIENVLLKKDNIVNVAVIGLQDEKWGEVPVAFVQYEGDLNKRDLVEYCKKEIGEYKIPKKFYKVDCLPINSSGKLQKFKIKEFLNDFISNEIK